MAHNRATLPITILIIGTVLAGGGTAVLTTVGELQTANALESDLGLVTLRTEVWNGQRTSYALRIVVVVPGSTAHKAGLTSGEVIVLSDTVSEFYRLMQESRGGAYSFTVSAAPVAGSIEKSPQRQVTVIVPP